MRCSLIYSLFMTLILMSSSSSYASYGKVYEISEDEIQDLCGTVGSGYSGWKYFREELAFITEEDDFETDDRKIIDFFLDRNHLLTCSIGFTGPDEIPTYYKKEHFFKYAAEAGDTGFFAELFDAVVATTTPQEGKELIDYRSVGNDGGEPAGESVLDFLQKIKRGGNYDAQRLRIIEQNINAIRFRALY